MVIILLTSCVYTIQLKLTSQSSKETIITNVAFSSILKSVHFRTGETVHQPVLFYCPFSWTNSKLPVIILTSRNTSFLHQTLDWGTLSSEERGQEERTASLFVCESVCEDRIVWWRKRTSGFLSPRSLSAETTMWCASLVYVAEETEL